MAMNSEALLLQPSSATDVPPPRHRLDPAAAAQLPRTPGIYAAWITMDAALEQVGIAGPAPRLVYVGIATSKAGLRRRLTAHVSTPWWELLDLLASRRAVLPAWWAHSFKNSPHRTLTIPALAQLASDEALAWQHEHLRWGWTEMPKAEAQAAEVAAIAAHRPLVNRKGLDYGAEPPPQLRATGPHEAARAWWLFHAAWLAVITIEEASYSAVDFGRLMVAVDEDGWPVPLADGDHQRLDLPSDWEAQRVLVGAAPSELRGAVADETDSEQAFAWWAAYSGHQFLPGGGTTHDALHGAFTRSDEGHRAPSHLPAEPTRSRLVALVKQLPRVTH
jgi:hypothetical protein